jgi:hypothetical protein
MRQMRSVYKILAVNPKGKHHIEGLSVDGRIILKWILKKQDRRMWAGFTCLEIGVSVRLL